ncbi:MAG: hypothetical protein AABY75_01965 [Bacteroidota bacterium]
MKRTTILLAVLAIAALMTQPVFAQATATQTVNLTVNSIYKLAVSGNPGALTISDMVVGASSASTSDASSNYSMTTNVANSRMTAQMDAALPAGLTLTIALVGGNGTTAGTVDVSDGTAKNVVTAIARGAANAQTITYGFTADASAGAFTGSRVVTLTLTNP